MKPGVDLVKRWVNEAQQAVLSDNVMVQVCLAVRCVGVEMCGFD